MPGLGLEWEYIADPLTHVIQTEGQTVLEDDKEDELEAADTLNKKMSEQKSKEVKSSEPEGEAQWSDYPAEDLQ